MVITEKVDSLYLKSFKLRGHHTINVIVLKLSLEK